MLLWLPKIDTCVLSPTPLCHAFILELTRTQQYHNEAKRRSASKYSAKADTPDAVITTRILPRFQTVQERNFCSHRNQPPALLRTYYGEVNGQDHDEAYQTMASNAELEQIIDENGAWNDKNLYEFSDDWQHILLRVPELCDQLESEVDEDGEGDEDGAQYEGTEAPPTSDDDALQGWLGYHDRKIVNRLYICDREALESGKIKVFYLDCHGKSIWHHKFKKENFIEYSGMVHACLFLDEINGQTMTRENGSEIFL